MMSVVSESAHPLRHGGFVAEYIGTQESGVPGVPNLPLYNLTRQIGDYPVGATVSAATLARLGYSAPAPIFFRKQVGESTPGRTGQSR